MTSSRSNKYKILFVLNHSIIAGTERHVIYLTKHINKKYFECSVLVFEKGPLVRLLTEMDVPVYVIERKYRFNLSTIIRTIRFCYDNKFDIIHSHCGIFAVILARMSGCKNVIETRHGLGIQYNQIRRQFRFNFLYNYFKLLLPNKIITVSNYDRNLLLKNFHFKNNKIVTVINGLEKRDCLITDDKQKKIKKLFKLCHDTFLIGTIARLEEQKGLKYLIQAAPLIKKQFQQFKIIIIGDGPLKENLKKQAFEQGVEDEVVFGGYRYDAQEIMPIFNIFVLPSLWEGMSYALLEAMSCGLPIITTDVFGNHELIDDGVNGFLVPPQDENAIAESICKLISDQKMRSEMGVMSKKRIKSFYTVERMAQQIEKIYFNLLRSN